MDGKHEGNIRLRNPSIKSEEFQEEKNKQMENQ